MDISRMINHIVPITQFNKGKASQLFSRVNHGETLLVIKNNSPVAVILSPEEYELLRKVTRMCTKSYETGNNAYSSELIALLNHLKDLDENGEKNV